MNYGTIADLKQFIGTTISQQTSDLREELNAISKDLKKLYEKVDEISSAIAESLDATSEHVDNQINGNEVRISKLEQNTA